MTATNMRSNFGSKWIVPPLQKQARFDFRTLLRYLDTDA